MREHLILQGSRSGAPVYAAGSVTHFSPRAAGAVGVCGSHGGINAVEFALRLGLRGLVVNDAGIGKSRAGVAGLETADQNGMPAIAVSNWSARIGDGLDCYESGLVSAANELAIALGIQLEMRAVDVIPLLRSAGPTRQLARRTKQPPLDRTSLDVVCRDSASEMTPGDEKRIVVCGSHGGVPDSRLLPVLPRAIFLNDAGIGKEGAGIARVLALGESGVPACAVSHDSAMIGVARDSLRFGVISTANQPSVDLGVKPGLSVEDAIDRFRESIDGLQ